MLKLAIVGCGKIADAHAAQIGRIAGCKIVAACDREPLMAAQLADRFPVGACYTDLNEMLERSRPDVVHVTTPPVSHYQLAKTCLDAGCHVYVEKPFTLYAPEAKELLDLAESRNLRITAGHDDQFSHVARRMRKLIAVGYLGSGPVHMESYYGYQMGDDAYARALLSDKNHWVRRLPGKLLHNIISHGIARIAEHLHCEDPTVIAHGATSPRLSRRGETEIVDELRVILADPLGGTTAYFTFSSQMRPLLHQFRIYGDKNGLVLDQDQETLIRLRGGHFTSYAEKFLPPLIFAGQYATNLRANLGRFLANDFHMKSGMKCLIESFYRHIEGQGPAPIPYREILLTARIMDTIFEQINAHQANKARSAVYVGV